MKYLVIGGVAMVAYGSPRMTFDLDLFIEPTRENAARLLRALLAVGLGTAALIRADQLLANEITVFRDIIRIDVMTRTPGLVFDEAWSRHKESTFRGQSFAIVSREDLIRAKEASGRPRDLEDVRVLRAQVEGTRSDPAGEAGR